MFSSNSWAIWLWAQVWLESTLTMIRTTFDRCTLLIATLSLCLGAHAQPVSTGWNLLANPIDVANYVPANFSNTSTVGTVWKWVVSKSSWAFYTPSLADGGTAHAATKGYDGLKYINPKEGFWVNAIAAGKVFSPSGNAVTLSQSDLMKGWNLVGSADNKTPAQLNEALGTSLNAAGKTIVTAWAWDASTSRWKFYAPALEAQGGTVLSDYITSKGYLPFTTPLSPSDGFWLNVGSLTPATSPTAADLFTQAPGGTFPDFSPYYNWSGWTAGGQIHSTCTAIADVNGDGRADFAVHYHQMLGTMGVTTNALVPNRLVVFASQPDGTYKDSTAATFGTTDPIVLPGASRKVVVADINGDGKLDWVYALNREDGRSYLPDVSAWSSQSAAVLSQADGTYKVLNIGDSRWYHAVGAVQSGGATQVLLGGDTLATRPHVGDWQTGFVFEGSQYQLNASGTDWVSQKPPPLSSMTFVALPPTTPNGLVTKIVTEANDNSGNRFVGLVSADQNGSWSLTSTYKSYQSKSVVDFVTWQAWRGTTTASLVNGQTVIGGAYYESGLLYPNPAAPPIVVMKLSGSVIAAPRSDGAYYQSDSVSYNHLEFYSVVGNSLAPAPITLLGETTAINSNFMDFVDVDNDGLQDIVVYPYANGGAPYVYLNTGAGIFANISPSVFPQAPDSWGGSATSKFLDADGDGIFDIYFWRGNGISPSDQINSTARLHFGTQAMLSLGNSITEPITISNRNGSLLIRAFGGDDTIAGGCSSTCSIDGGYGVNTIVYAGNRGNYTITRTATGYTIRDTVGSDGTDNVKNIQLLKFADMTIDLRIGGY